MFDKELVRSILAQIDEALEQIDQRTSQVKAPSFFTDSPQGKEKLDSVCMLLIAIGESLKISIKLPGAHCCRIIQRSIGQGQKNFATS